MYVETTSKQCKGEKRVDLALSEAEVSWGNDRDNEVEYCSDVRYLYDGHNSDGRTEESEDDPNIPPTIVEANIQRRVELVPDLQGVSVVKCSNIFYSQSTGSIHKCQWH